MSKTKTATIRVLALFGLIATLGPAAVMAQQPVLFTIPFDFTVGTKSLAAGDYLVYEELNNVIVLRANNGHGDGTMIMANADQPGKVAGKTIMTFHRYGSQNFLSSVADINRGWRVPPAAGERELIAGKTSPKPLEVIASSKK